MRYIGERLLLIIKHFDSKWNLWGNTYIMEDLIASDKQHWFSAKENKYRNKTNKLK